MLQQELRWRQQAEALQFEEPNAEIAQRHLLEFVRYGHPAYRAGWFQRELCAKLEWFSREVAAERSPRLLIAAPPRSGKSEIVSRRWPIWHLGHHPTHEVVITSYGQDLSTDMSRDARAIRESALEFWPHLAPKKGGKDGVEHWQISGGGSVKAVGAGGPLTGRGAHALVIDDPFKNSEEADSLLVRDSRWRWYQTTAYPRLAPGGGVLVMATRWHHDDMSGRLLDQRARGEENWQEVRFPAIAEEDEPYRKAGEALHPERYDCAALAQIRSVLGARAWNALYQQRPTPDTGGMFKRDWTTQRYDHDPQRPTKPYTEIVTSVDATFKDAKTSDYVSIQAWGRYDWLEYHLLDEVHARMDFVGTRQALRDHAKKWRPSAVLIEEAANGYALLADLKKEVPGLIGIDPRKAGSKDARASVSTPRWEAGEVWLPADAPWVGDYVEELLSYPLGVHDDRVDAQSQLFVWWAEKRRTGGGTKALNNAVSGLLQGRARR